MSEQWALITGCSEGGIGDGLARSLHAKGIKVIASARNVSKINSAFAAKPGVETLALDVNDQKSIDAAVEKVRDLTSGDLHYLINNSGVSYYSPILDLELSHVRNIFETNFMSLIAMTQAFFPLLRAAQGTVINNSSSAGVDAGYVPFGGAYGASKSAAAKLSQTLRVELAPFGVKVVTLYAGGIETGIWNSTAAYAELKSDSVCQPMKKEVEHIMSGAFMQNSPLDPFAEGVVAEITRYNPPRERWSGKLSSTVWWMNFLAPRWLIDYGFSDQSGLSLLKGRLEEQKKNS